MLQDTYSVRTCFWKITENYFLFLFRKCSADLLNRVDNYGLLNLDIVWTYLHLKSLQYISDAEARLKICEDSFYRCYGANLERLADIKGATGNVDELISNLFLQSWTTHPMD